MWIMGADSKELAYAKYFKIQKVMGGKDKKWALVGYFNCTGMITSEVICAYFSDEDKAIAALEKVCDFIEETPEKVYRFDKLYK